MEQRRVAEGEVSDGDLEALSAFVARHPRLTVLTGAGISTASGIPDYRDRQGGWKRPPPMQHQQFMGSHAARQRYWARALVGFRALGEARPNVAHRVLAELEGLGRISGVITQNVDGLHQRAGSRRVIDLHGRADRVRCMACGASRMRHALHAELASLNPHWATRGARAAPDGDADLETDFSGFVVPDCTRCGDGVWKPDVVFFGEQLPQDAFDRAHDAVRRCDDLIVAGTAAEVEPAASLPRLAEREGARIWEINPDPTLPTDRRIPRPAEHVLPALVERLRSQQ